MPCYSNVAHSSLFFSVFVSAMVIYHSMAFAHTSLLGSRHRQPHSIVTCSNLANDGTPTVMTANSGLEIKESAFLGAGGPTPALRPEDLPSLLMEALHHNDFPHVDAGLTSMWAFCSDTTRHVFQHNRTEFIESAHETAKEFPTSFYGNAFFGREWEMETELNRIGAGAGDSWIATQVMKTISSDGRMRRWQWEIRKNRRPPNLDCWFVESIASSDRKGEFEPDN